MRKLIYGINVSLDGCCDHTKFGGGKDAHEYFQKLLESADTLLYGRKTYDLMIPFWPEVAVTQSLDELGNAFANVFVKLNRVLVSRTVKRVDDANTTVINDNLEEAITKLKRQPGRPISTGGVELPARLIELGLVDEFHIVVHPVLVGEGRRLFSEMRLPENQGLRLVDSLKFDSGCMVLKYEKI
jgi:dihydrofolate reductase